MGCASRWSTPQAFARRRTSSKSRAWRGRRRAYRCRRPGAIVVDRSRPLDQDDDDIFSQTTDINRLIVVNKADAAAPGASGHREAVLVSATTGYGLDDLRRQIAAALDVDSLADRPSITNVRHIALVQRAHEALGRARAQLRRRKAARSRGVRACRSCRTHALRSKRSSDAAPASDVLAHIFSRFVSGSDA